MTVIDLWFIGMIVSIILVYVLLKIVKKFYGEV